MDDLIAALTIFRKYDNARNPTHCEHDRLTVHADPADVSPEDVATLERLGFLVDEREECFYSFRFGSA